MGTAADSPRNRLVLPLVCATLATQASIVVLAPIVVEIARELDSSVSGIGVARSVLAGTAVAASLGIGPLIDRIGVRPLIIAGGAFGIAGAGVSAAAPALGVFYAGAALQGLAVACLLSAGFAGVALYFDGRAAARAMGYVVASQSLAWIVGNPLIGVLTDASSWRLAYAVPATAAAIALAAGLLLPRHRRTAGIPGGGLVTVLRDASARRWALAELVAYAAWTGELTYAGAFYIETYGLDVTTTGLLLAIGSAVFAVTTLRTAALTERFERKPLIVIGAIGMGLLLIVLMNVTPSVAFTILVFCGMAGFAGIRTTGSSALGLDQLPDQPGSMMAARTASAQLGYVIGAAVGAGVLAAADFGALGLVLAAGMAFSAFLVTRVSDPSTAREPGAAMLPEPVPD